MYICVVRSLTGSSSLKTREKKRIKSTAEDLVMVYLECHKIRATQ